MATRVSAFVALAVASGMLVRGAPSAAATGGENLVRNGGFEQVDPETGLPVGWRFDWQYTHSSDRARGVKKQRPDYGVDTDVTHGGGHSFRIGVKRPADDGVLTQDAVSVRRGVRVYRLEAWVRARGLRGAAATVGVVFLGKGGRWRGADYAAISVEKDRDWRRYTALVEPPAGVESFRLRLWVNFGYSGVGTAWFDDVRLTATDLREKPPLAAVDDAPMPPLKASWREAGFVLFRRTWLDMVFPTSMPRADEIGGVLKAAAAPGEVEPVVFCLRSLRALRGVGIEFEPFQGPNGAVISPDRVARGVVRLLYRRGQTRWGPLKSGRMLMPVYVAPAVPFDIEAGRTIQFWNTLAVPADAAPGVYRGAVRVSTGSGVSRRLQVRLTVHPFALETPPHMFFGMYSRRHDGPGRMDEIYRDMREHGMTTVGFCGPLGAPVVRAPSGRVTVEFQGDGDLEKAMVAYMRAGFPRPFVWLMGNDIHRWCLKQGPLESNRFATAYREIILRILEHGRDQGWPEIIFQPVDEPFEHNARLPLAKRCLRILKSIPGVRTEEDGPNGRPELLDELYPWTDVLVFHDGPVMRRTKYDGPAWAAFLERTRADHKSVWFYNIDLTASHPEVMRWGYGFGLWFSGATGMLEWAYQFPAAGGRPERAYRNEGAVVYRFPPWEQEPGGPSIGWEGIREGVDDCRYLWTLEQALRAAEKSGDPRRVKIAGEARDWLEELRQRCDFRGHEGSACQGDWVGGGRVLPSGQKVVSGPYKMANGWTFAQYDRARRRIAAFIQALRAPD
ncbi:MAG: hypothetical protein GXP31_00320 [Kiritimatiellaeota bacterium]|nr:hypothetical protein [Kiritimatiellota bacterium]